MDMPDLEDADSGSEAGNTVQERSIGCFPVANLGDDFDGEPTNGAEYLAMIQSVKIHGSCQVGIR